MIRRALMIFVIAGAASALAQPPQAGVGARGAEQREALEPTPPAEPGTEPPTAPSTPPANTPPSTPPASTPTSTPPRSTPPTQPSAPPQTPTSAPPQPPNAPPQVPPVSPDPISAPPAPTPDPAPIDPVETREPQVAAPTTAPTSAPEPPRAETAQPTATEPAPNSTAPSQPNNVFIPVPMEADNVFWDELREFDGMFGGDGTKSGLFLLFLELLVCIAFTFGLRRVRDFLPAKGLIPGALAVVHLLARLLVVAIATAIIARGLPPRATLVLLLAFVGFALALGWSSRDVLPDMIAGFVLAFERRIRSGMWIRSSDFAGQVESVGIRSTLIRDAQGRQVSIPNRHLLRLPVTSDLSHELEQDVLLRIESDAPAERIRSAIRDAVLSSPWVLPGADPIVLRDPDDAWIWRVRSRLLAMRFAVAFEGELLERAEEMLAAYHPGKVDPEPPEPES